MQPLGARHSGATDILFADVKTACQPPDGRWPLIYKHTTTTLPIGSFHDLKLRRPNDLYDAE
jgi:hypothetical protein